MDESSPNWNQQGLNNLGAILILRPLPEDILHLLLGNLSNEHRNLQGLCQKGYSAQCGFDAMYNPATARGSFMRRISFLSMGRGLMGTTWHFGWIHSQERGRKGYKQGDQRRTGEATLPGPWTVLFFRSPLWPRRASGFWL